MGPIMYDQMMPVFQDRHDHLATGEIGTDNQHDRLVPDECDLQQQRQVGIQQCYRVPVGEHQSIVNTRNQRTAATRPSAELLLQNWIDLAMELSILRLFKKMSE
jgi:hypothetical protein